MPGKILIVDDVATNRIVLQVKLSTACYRTVQAQSGQEALRMARRHRPDLILLSGELPDADSMKLCEELKTICPGQTSVLMMLRDNDAGNRLSALKAGADDVLVRPIDDLMLRARLRSLLRARDAEEELRLRDGTQRALGFAESGADFEGPANIAIISRNRIEGAERAKVLGETLPHKVSLMSPEAALQVPSAKSAPDIMVIIPDLANPQGDIRLLPDLRARSATRHTAIMVVLGPDDRNAAADALDMGANDLLTSGFDMEELRVRIPTQIRRKRMADRLRANVRDGLRAAVIDPLTGLYNRRYAMPHLARIAERAHETKRGYAVMVADLDHFKRVNDQYGHAAGDAVLVEVARRLRDNMRAVDLVARIGGEEFLVAMPETDHEAAQGAASRLRRVMAATPVLVPGTGQEIPITVSIGISLSDGIQEIPSITEDVNQMLDAADKALYGSKAQGRNQVTISRPAA